MGGGGRSPPATEWPNTENSEITEEFEWLVNTEWKGKTSKYLFRRDGLIESSLKECQQEQSCLWAANNGRVLINTPTLKVVKFTVDNFHQVDRKKLMNKVEEELQKIVLTSEKVSKSGSKSTLNFAGVATADASENVITKDLYKLLDVEPDVDQSKIKSAFRRFSVVHHPDKGGDVHVFNEVRDAYEILADVDLRKYYDVGGVQLVRNMETAFKELEGQKAQLDSQLNQVPKNHPQRKAFEAQVEQQKRQFEKSRAKPEIEGKMRSDDVEVLVPVSAEELYTGVPRKSFDFQRLVICRGCRANLESEECQDCGRCPPEKVQVPQYANTPFGKQVVGMKEKEQESLERCRVTPVIVEMKVSKGAKADTILKTIADMGHQTPGKLPGRLVLKVQRGSPTDRFSIAENDLHTVMRISLEDALFGFSMSWKHIGDEMLTISHDRVTQPDEVVRFRKKGLGGDRSRGDLYVRLLVELPIVSGTSLTLKGSREQRSEPMLFKEDNVILEEGSPWRRWSQRENSSTGILNKRSDEL